jgi:hypothetical protein
LALDARAVEAQIWLALMLINRVLDFLHGFFHYDAMRPIGRHRQGFRNQLICALKVDVGCYVKGQVLRAQSRLPPRRPPPQDVVKYVGMFG